MAVTAQDVVLARCSTDCVVRRIAGKEIVAAAADRVLDQGAWIASELQGIEDVAAGELCRLWAERAVPSGAHSSQACLGSRYSAAPQGVPCRCTDDLAGCRTRPSPSAARA